MSANYARSYLNAIDCRSHYPTQPMIIRVRRESLHARIRHSAQRALWAQIRPSRRLGKPPKKRAVRPGPAASALAERDLHVLDLVDLLAVRLDPAVGDAHRQPARLNGLGEIDVVGQHFPVGPDHAGELHLAHSERVAASLPAAPAEVEAGELPEAIEAETARHDRIAGKMAFEEPEIGLDVELGDDMALAVRATVGGDVGDPVHHQHRRQGQLRVARPEKLAPGAGQKGLLVEGRRIIRHESSPLGALPSGQTSSTARTPRARARDTRDGSSGVGEWPPSPLRKTIVNRGRSTLYCAPMAQEISYSDTGDLGATWLASAGLRPTRQRVALAELLVGDGRNRHVTAESLHAASREAGDGVSLATVYNTLRAFCDAGLMREITVDGSKSYFDTRIDDHPHFYWEEDGRLTDAPATDLEITRLPDAPNGAEVASVDVVIRLRKSG